MPDAHTIEFFRYRYLFDALVFFLLFALLVLCFRDIDGYAQD